MPTYDYFCAKCRHELEVVQKITEVPLKECPKCHAQELVRRPGGGIGLAFSGDGFYATMYGKNSVPADTPPKSPPSGGGGCCPCGKGGGCTS